MLSEGPDNASSGVVNQDIQPTEAIDCQIDRSFGDSLRRQIAGIADNLRAEFLAKVFCCVIEFRFIHISNNQPGSIARKSLCNRKANASCGARHNGDVIFQFLVHPALLSQNDADTALGTETLTIQQAAFFLNTERAISWHETIPVAAEIRVGHAILGAVGDECRTDFQIIADALPDPYIADEMPRF
jgi:hypothetical protein